MPTERTGMQGRGENGGNKGIKAWRERRIERKEALVQAAKEGAGQRFDELMSRLRNDTKLVFEDGAIEDARREFVEEAGERVKHEPNRLRRARRK